MRHLPPGVAKPEQLSDILSKTMLTKGEESAISKYEMRAPVLRFPVA
jgi:hypothetical protein